MSVKMQVCELGGLERDIGFTSVMSLAFRWNSLG